MTGKRTKRVYTVVYCCGCEVEVDARLTDGAEVYPHRGDLKSLPFWKCDECGNTVGCHHKSKNPTKPLGVIATPDLKVMRIRIHKILDPLWQRGKISRKKLYQKISDHLGYRYHTSALRTEPEAEKVYQFVYKLSGKPITLPGRPTAPLPKSPISLPPLRDPDPDKLPWED